MSLAFGGPDSWASVREIAPERFAKLAAYERRFGCTIMRGESVEELADRGKPHPGCDDATLVW